MTPMLVVGADWLYVRTRNIFLSWRESRRIIDTIGPRTRRFTGNRSSMHAYEPSGMVDIHYW